MSVVSIVENSMDAGFYGEAGARINMVGPVLARELGGKTVKLAIDGGFTCPNRDGRAGYGGCSFCSAAGSGDNASDIDSQIELLGGKWKADNYIAYFQSFTGTYAPAEELREKYCSALSHPGIKGIAVATRPDCLPDDVMDLLSEIRRDHYMWIELGLQTARDDVAESFGRGYPLSVYNEAAEKLRSRGIRFVTHIILGLPGETHDDMLRSALHACQAGSWGLKLHLLNMIKGTRMAEEHPGYVPFDSPEEYMDLVCDILERIPPEVVIHRLSADAKAEDLIAPKWAYRKRLLINGINKNLAGRGTRQGSKFNGF